jgi:putative transposase
MPTDTRSRIESGEVEGRAGVERGEPGGRAPRDAGAAGGLPLGPPLALLAEREPALGIDELPDELFDELLSGVRTQEDLFGGEGLLKQLTRRLVQRALEVELTEHLGYRAGEAPPGGAGNSRNGLGRKTLLTATVRSGSARREIATARLSRRSCARASGGWPAWTRRSWRCTRAGCRCATSAPSCRRSTAPRSRPT